MEKSIAENKMGVMPMNRLLITMSLPMMISMLIQALYNVVDSIFVAQLSENALTAVSLAFPYQNLMIGLAVGTGTGVNALLARSLGEKNFKVVNRCANNGIFLAVLSYLLFLVLGLCCSDAYFRFQTDIVEIIEMGNTYLRIVSSFSMGLFIAIMLERLLQATGRTFLTMITQGIGAIVNIVLDPLLIFGIGPFPEMGITGAAVATVIGQLVGMVLVLIFNVKYNPEVQLSFKKFRPNGAIVKQIYIVGIPVTVMNSIGSVMTMGMNIILMGFSSTATAVFGIYYKLLTFAFMPVFGLNNGLIPIASYNLGARKKARLIRVIQLSSVYAFGIMVLGMIILMAFPAQILSLFDASAEMYALGIPALRIASTSFVMASFCVVSAGACQVMGHSVVSMVISFVRQLVVLLPVAYLLSLTGNVNLVWYAFPIAEVVAFLCCVLIMRKMYREVIVPLGD